MMKLILRKDLFKPTLIAFATALVIVLPTAASAMPMSDSGGAVNPRAFVVPSTNLTDGWYSAALQQTPVTDGWYSAVVKQSPLVDGWYSAVRAISNAPASAAPAVATPTATGSFPYRNAGMALASALLIAALLATAVTRTRRDRHIPVLQ
jgi:hypothetical protein